MCTEASVPPEPRTDEALLAATRDGDKAAFQELFLRYYDRLCRFALAMVNQREAAEDVVADVFLMLWERREDVRISSSLKAFLYGTTRNHAVNHVRLLARENRVTLDHSPQGELLDDRSGLTIALGDEVQNELDRVIALLPEQRRLIFCLNRFDGLRYKEIAKALKLSEHTVQNHMMLAIKQLAPCLPRLRGLLRR